MLLKDYDLVACLVVDKRFTELTRLHSMLHNQGVTRVANFITGKGKLLPPSVYEMVSPLPPIGWRHPPQGYCHFAMIQRIVSRAKCMGLKNVLIVEDDCVLINNASSVIANASEFLPDDWDIYYYGANHSNSIMYELTPNLFHVCGSLTTHCVAIHSRAFDRIVSYSPSDMIDAMIARDRSLSCYAIWPSVAIQKPGLSTLWHIHTDYTDLFNKKGVVKDEDWEDWSDA